MSNTEINALMAEYASDGCDLSNDKNALLIARRLVSTMPDSQARCALHALTLRIATLEHKLSEAKERKARLTRLLSETCGHLKGRKMSMLASTPERLLAKIEAVLKEQNNG